MFVPVLGPLYARLTPMAEAMLRVLAGLLLVVHGTGKIVDPFAMVAMVEGLGFHPGEFWSPLLAVTEFFGGILIALGLFTRPAAFAGAIVLAVTAYFHGMVMDEGLTGMEKSLLWMMILLFFAVRGTTAYGIDRRLNRQF
ncbi:DoxX family protein [Rhizobium sp. RU20A]|uniref:DoxX family protein n=1 Tax=Rhizobium sp. RU20A TaxID=1907412 RepID=UPI00165FD716|nr:DoxX family protein [Rhizobium sp. RU20A]